MGSVFCARSFTASKVLQEASRCRRDKDFMADFGDAAYWLFEPINSSLSPHGPGNNLRTTATVSILAVILSKNYSKSIRDFYPFFSPIPCLCIPTKAVIAMKPSTC